MAGTEVKSLKVYLSGLAEIGFLESFFLHIITAIFFVIKLVVFMRAYSMSNIALVLKGQTVLFQSFLVRLGETFLVFYLLLIGLFFLGGKDK